MLLLAGLGGDFLENDNDSFIVTQISSKVELGQKRNFRFEIGKIQLQSKTYAKKAVALLASERMDLSYLGPSLVPALKPGERCV